MGSRRMAKQRGEWVVRYSNKSWLWHGITYHKLSSVETCSCTSSPDAPKKKISSTLLLLLCLVPYIFESNLVTHRWNSHGLFVGYLSPATE